VRIGIKRAALPAALHLDLAALWPPHQAEAQPKEHKLQPAPAGDDLDTDELRRSAASRAARTSLRSPRAQAIFTSSATSSSNLINLITSSTSSLFHLFLCSSSSLSPIYYSSSLAIAHLATKQMRDSGRRARGQAQEGHLFRASPGHDRLSDYTCPRRLRPPSALPSTSSSVVMPSTDKRHATSLRAGSLNNLCVDCS
jgi:hypothetical protein